MTVIGTGQTNYGNGYPEINYGGVTLRNGPLVTQWPNLPAGLGSLDTTSVVTYGAIGLAAFWLLKKFKVL